MTAGRHRAFNEHEALEAAMRVFWGKGYAGASLTDLTQAMGINKPSMYAAFGNKEQLFMHCLNHYIGQYANSHAALLSHHHRSVEQRLRAYLMSVIGGQCDLAGPLGCFITASINESISEDFPAAASEQVHRIKHLGEQLLTDFFNQAIEQQHLPSDFAVAHHAAYFISIMHGTSALARAGKSLEELTAVIDTALLVLEQSVEH